MFDFVFGGKRKLALIRELLEQRMRAEGFDDMSSKLKVKELGRLELTGTPEGVLVTVIETVVKSQKHGMLLATIIKNIEDHRSSLGSDIERFKSILAVAQSNEAGDAVPAYCKYRLDIESPGRVSEEQFANAFLEAVPEISSW